MVKKAFAVFVIFTTLFISMSAQLVNAQTSNDDLSPKSQQYIDNLNELKEAQNNGQPVNDSSATSNQGTSVWTYAFYGALSGAAYAFWRWLKKLRNRG